MGGAQSSTSVSLVTSTVAINTSSLALTSTTTSSTISSTTAIYSTLSNTETQPAIPTTFSTLTRSSSSSSIAPAYTSTSLPKATGSPKFLFMYGDSYTSTTFNIAGTKPSLGNQLGNPNYPGVTSTGSNQPNWVDQLTMNAPSNTLTYNFAVGGASVDNNLTEGAYADTPAFLNQSQIFLTNLKSKPSYCRWTAANSAHIIWFGRNDVFWMVSQNVTMSTRLDAVIASYFNIVNSLWVAGARQFVVLGMPPMQLEPLWSSTQPNLAGQGRPSNTFEPQIPPAVAYWDTNLRSKLAAWKKGKPAVKLGYVDTIPAYSRVLNNPNAWGDLDGSCRNDDTSLPSPHRCPFSDTVHPGPDLATSIAITVGRYLASTGFLSGFALSYNDV